MLFQALQAQMAFGLTNPLGGAINAAGMGLNANANANTNTQLPSIIPSLQSPMLMQLPNLTALTNPMQSVTSKQQDDPPAGKDASPRLKRKPSAALDQRCNSMSMDGSGGTL